MTSANQVTNTQPLSTSANTSPTKMAPPAAANVDQPIRLLKVLTLFNFGGTETQVVNLTRNIDRERYDLRFACLRKWGPFLKEIEQRDIPVEEFGITSLYKPHTLRQLFRLARYMRKHRIQIAHSYNFYANMLTVPAAKLAGVPVVIASIRDCGVYLTPKQKLVNKFVCSMADKILVNAVAIKDWLLEQGYPEHKIDIIRNGIDMTPYNECRNNLNQTTNSIREEFGIASSAPIVVMLSRLNRLKGVNEFLFAAAEVTKSHPDVKFMIVGEKLAARKGSFGKDERYHQELKYLVDRLGLNEQVIFTGYRSDTPAILSEANVSVLPSHNEGLSNTLIESLAAGVPIVTTRVGGNPEIVEHGVNGLLVPVKSPEPLAQAIKQILENPDLAASMKEANRERARDMFSIDKMVTDTENYYVKQLGATD